MPELPEVETIVRTLRPGVVSRRIEGVRVVRKDVIEPVGLDIQTRLKGRVVLGLNRRGKKIVFELDGGERFFIHLGMTGRLTLVAAGAPLLPHTHVIFRIDGREMRFVDPRRFGGVFWLGDKDAGEELGPEPLEMTADELAERLAKTRRAVKTALLDQRMLAGVGNIYADEALFHAGIDPRVAANRLSKEQIAKLSESIKIVLNRAIEHKGSTLRDYRDGNGEPGSFQNVHQVYDRDEQPCLTCGGLIKRIVLGGRSTHFCTNCQRRRHKRAGEPATRGRRIQ